MRIFLEGPQGSGKTTLSHLLSEQLSQEGLIIPRLRGIPNGVYLKSHSEEENWEKSLELSTLSPAIYDRSPLSITVYDAQEEIVGSQVWEYHLPVFLDNLEDVDLLILLECSIERAFGRQGPETLCSLDSLNESKQEHARYNHLKKLLESEVMCSEVGAEIMTLNTDLNTPESSVEVILEKLSSEVYIMDKLRI
jgi:hypothetical protein